MNIDLLIFAQLSSHKALYLTKLTNLYLSVVGDILSKCHRYQYL